AWPRNNQEDLYRVESRGVRVTALDFVAEASLDFLSDGAARYVVEAAPGTSVRVGVVRRSPGDSDALAWGGRRLALGRSASLELELAADEGVAAAGRRFVAVRLEAQGSRITFSGSP